MTVGRTAAEIFFVPVGREILLYAPLARSVALVNEEAFRLAATARCAAGTPLSPALGEIEPMFAPPAHIPGPRTGPCHPRSIGLITTRRCDMSCVYCDFHESLGTMDERVAFRALEWFADRKGESGASRLDVQLFGGEPFLPMDLVKRIEARARSLARERGLESSLCGCTNGTASEEDARWLAETFDALTVSLDGPPEIQDRQRPMKAGGASSARVDRTARILSEGRCELTIRMCVTAGTVAHVERATRWLTERYAPSTVVIEPVRGSRARGALAPPEPEAFVRAFAAAARLLAGHGIEAVHSAARIGDLCASFCPVGDDGFIVAPDGRVSACYLPEEAWLASGLDLGYGRVSPDGGVDVRERDLARIRTLVGGRPRCRSCFCRWHCAGGCHVAAATRAGEDDASCRQTRAVTLWRLLFEMGLEEQSARFLEHPVVLGDGLL